MVCSGLLFSCHYRFLMLVFCFLFLVCPGCLLSFCSVVLWMLYRCVLSVVVRLFCMFRLFGVCVFGILTILFDLFRVFSGSDL